MSSSLHNLSSYNPNELPSAATMRIAILISEWNPEITQGLLNAAVETLLSQGASQDKLMIHWVPGSFELPSAANIIIEALLPDAVICLGCVIQGETRHFDFICQSVANGITQVSIKHNIPVIFGVLTTNTFEQAKARSGGEHGNKGVEAAVAAIKMLALKNQLKA